MNKKGQWATIHARENARKARLIRRNYSCSMSKLGFDNYEIGDFLGVSSQTITLYLREGRGAVYHDLQKFCLEKEIFQLFDEKEQKALAEIRELREELEYLTGKWNSIDYSSKGKGIMGLIHKHILKDIEQIKKENQKRYVTIQKEYNKLQLLQKQIKNKSSYPHLSKIDFKVKLLKEVYNAKSKEKNVGNKVIRVPTLKILGYIFIVIGFFSLTKGIDLSGLILLIVGSLLVCKNNTKK